MSTCSQSRTECPRRPVVKRLRAAVIGLGVGEAHISGYRSHPACEVVALCDSRGDRLRQVGANYPGVALTESADDVLDDPDIDVVSIASYDDCHYEQVVRAIENDKHVFVEKPMCLTEAEARDIRQLLEGKPHLRLSSNLILRRCPRFLALKARIGNGEFGDLFQAEGDYNYGRLNKITEGWRGRIEFYSVVHGGGVHIVDLLMWLTGCRIIEVSAFGTQVPSLGSQFRFNDTVISALKFENGIVGKLGVSFGCVRPHFHGLAIYGTKATFVNGDPEGRLYASCDPSVPPTRIDEAYPGVHKAGLIGSFIETIVTGHEPVVGEEDVFRSTSVCLAIEKAVASGGRCPVTYI